MPSYMYIAIWCCMREICLAGSVPEYGKQWVRWASWQVYLASKTAYFFVKVVLFGIPSCWVCIEPSIPPNLGQTLRSLGASSSSHCLGHRELVYKLSVQTTPANPVLIYFWSTSVCGLDRMCIQFSYKIVRVVRTRRNQFECGLNVH